MTAWSSTRAALWRGMKGCIAHHRVSGRHRRRHRSYPRPRRQTAHRCGGCPASSQPPPHPPPPPHHPPPPPPPQSPRLSLSAAVAAFSASLSRPPQPWSSPAPPISTSDSSPPKAISLSVAVGLVPVAPVRMKSRPAPPITLSSPPAVLT